MTPATRAGIRATAEEMTRSGRPDDVKIGAVLLALCDDVDALAREAEAAGCMVALLARRGEALGPRPHLPNEVPTPFQPDAARFLDRVGLDAWGRRVGKDP